MKNEIQGEGWYERFLRWAGGEEPDGPEGPEDRNARNFWSIWSTSRPTETWSSGPIA